MLVKDYFNKYYSPHPSEITPGCGAHRGAQARFARHTGVSYQTVQRWVKYGYTVKEISTKGRLCHMVVKQLKHGPAIVSGLVLPSDNLFNC